MIIVLTLLAAGLVGGMLRPLVGSDVSGSISTLLWLGGSAGLLIWRSAIHREISQLRRPEIGPSPPNVTQSWGQHPAVWVQPPPPQFLPPGPPQSFVQGFPAPMVPVGQAQWSGRQYPMPSPEVMVASMQILAPIEPLEEQIEVAGEVNYTRQLRAVFGSAGVEVTDRGATVNHVPVVLVPEPANEFDENAVAVLIPGAGIVGYLPRNLAQEYSPILLRIARSGRLVSGTARVWAKRQPGGALWPRVTVMTTPSENLNAVG